MRTKGCDMLGAFVPQHISAYFNLLAENKKITKSALLNILIKDWYLENREIWDYADLLKEKQHSIQLEWKVIKQNKDHVSFDSFLERQYILLVKKIGIKDTELIIKSIVE